MKKILVILITLLLTGCAPSEEAIQKAIVQTQTAYPPMMMTPTQAAYPTMTMTPTPKVVATLMPTSTKWPTPEPNYLLETGFCIMSIKRGEITGNPADTSGCGVQNREQVYIGPLQEMTITFNNETQDLQRYCALFDLDGNFIMFDLDITASHKVTCSPN